MQKKIVLGIVTLLMLSILLTPTFAWVHNDGSEDGNYERFGPRAGTLLIHLYGDDTAEFNAMAAGDLDITDWPLSKTVYDTFSAMPEIGIANYGPEFGLFLIDINSNDNTFLGNPDSTPPDTCDEPNLVGDQNDALGNPDIKGGDVKANNFNPMSNVYLRRAIAHLVDRDGLIADPFIGAGFGFPMYTMMPAGMPKYLLTVEDDPTMPWAWDYDPIAAVAMLEANDFPINNGTGFRFWDRNGDDIEQDDEWLELIFYIRADHPGRNMIGTVLVAEMAAVDLRVNAQFATSGTTFVNVMVKKNFHMYTGGWSLGVDPDHLILWSWDYYWHPGFCYDYGGHNDAAFNAAAAGIMYSNTQAEAVTWAMVAQEAQAMQVLGIPLYCVSGNKAFYKTNVGGHPTDTSEGEAWEDSFVNMAGYGIDNGHTFRNMHTVDTQYSDDMVIDWGFKVPDIKQLNPVYSSWLFDWNVLDHMYDSLLSRNASDLGEFLPSIAKNYELTTYTHPTYGTCSKVTFSLRHDAVWSDGTPLTVADVHFTFVELKKMLSDRGLPNPWWWSNVQDILSFTVLGANNFEVLLRVKSYWAAGWIGGCIILPKHIWYPIAETGDPQDMQPDPTLLGSSSWKFVDYVENSYVKLERNPVYHRQWPLAFTVENHDDLLQKFDEVDPGAKDLTVTVENLDIGGATNYDITITVTDPLGVDTPHTYTGETLAAGASKQFVIAVTWTYGRWGVHVDISGQTSWGLNFDISVCIWRCYITIKEDIAGRTYYDDIGLSTYPYKKQLPTPDIMVDIKDISRAAKAFGGYPGHPRWSSVADITGDYLVDIRDISGIAKRFGWLP